MESQDVRLMAEWTAVSSHFCESTRSSSNVLSLMSDGEARDEGCCSGFTRHGSGKTQCRAGTFNARSLRSKIKKQLIIQDFEQYDLDVFGVTETWIDGNGIDTMDNGHVMYHSGGSSGCAGVGIFTPKWLKNNIVSYKFYSERIISIRLAIDPHRDSRTVTVVCCYASTLQHSTKYPAEADSFYSVLSSIAGSVKRRDELWIVGDFNAKVGSSVGGTSGPVDSYSKHTSEYI